MTSHDTKVILHDADGRQAPGYLLGAAQGAEDGRVCVVLDAARGLVLALGGEAELELDPDHEEGRVRLRGRVLQHRVGRDAGWYVLEIDEVDRPLLGAGSNRRQHQRARPGLAAPIAARLASLDGAHTHEVTVKDLSEGGAGLIVRPPEDLGLLAGPRLRLELQLRPDEAPLALVVQLVFRRQSGSMLHYGIAFDGLATPGFEEIRERLGAWVAQRREEQQRASAPTRRAG
jgi:hypothetical protein